MFVTNHRIKKHKIVVIEEGTGKCDFRRTEHIWFPTSDINRNKCETCKMVVEKQYIE